MAEAQTLSIRDGMFQVHVFTKGKGTPLLFLHSSGGLAEWPPWLDPFAERFRVIAPQHPGFGASTGLEHLDDFIDLALYYLDFMDALGLERAHLMGHSLGGNIAAEVAALAPERVGRLVLVGATGLWLDATPVADFFSMNNEELQKIVWHNVEQAQAKGLIVEPQSEAERRVAALERARAFAAAAKFLWPIPDKGLKKRIHRIKAPTLLVWGESDGLVPPAYGHLFQEKIPDAKLAIISEAGHSPMREQPEEFTRVVMEFLTGRE